MAKYVKQEETTGKNGNWMKPSNRNEIDMIANKVEDDREEDGVTGEVQQRQKYEIRRQLLIPPMTVDIIITTKTKETTIIITTKTKETTI